MKIHAAGVAAVLTILNGLGAAPAGAETIATLTKGQSNPIVRGVRVGSENMAGKLGDKSLHFVPRTENSVPEQIALADEVLSNKPDALVFSPSDPKALVPAVDKFNAAGIAVVNVIDRLAGGQAVAYVGNDDYDLAMATARYLFKAMGGKGNIVMLEGPPTLPTAVARSRGFNDALKEFPEIKLLAAKSANYARPVALQNMRDFLRAYPQIDGVLAGNDPMAIGANDALKAAGKKALVVGINASTEVLEYIKSGEIVASGDYNGYFQGCLGAEIAVRHLRKQEAPKEVILKSVVIDKTNYQPYETPMEKRTCPTLDSVAGK
ncbi:MAG TPA: sugar ABC transporter substrate-binding protein [Xanthobacteraceae bacterium]|jgi:ribose transport system substrate-binding protein